MAKKGAFGEIELGAVPAVIGEVRRIAMRQSANEIDVTVMGSGFSALIPGTIQAGFDVDVFIEDGDAGQDFVLNNLGSDTAVAFKYRPNGTGSGLPEWSGNVYVLGADIEQAADGAIEGTLSLPGDGTPFAKATQP